MLVHLLELRRRAMLVMSVFAALFILFFYFANDLFSFIISPLLHALPFNNSLIATQITSPVLTPLKLAANLAMITCTPYALFQLWQFTAPALYKNERQHILIPVVSSLLLFCIGMAFCFYGVLPFMFQFFVSALPNQVKMMPDIGNAVDFITRMLLIFGLCFQVPLLCWMLVRLQWLTLASLKQIRPYVIVMAFTVGMLLTPPDVLSQIMLAVPLCVLYESGILLARWQPALRVNQNVVTVDSQSLNNKG